MTERLSMHAHIVSLQCCPSFCCILMWISCEYTYIPLPLDWVVEFLTSASLGSRPLKKTKNPSQGQHLPLSQARYREWPPWILPSLCVSQFAQCLGEGGLLCSGEQLTLEKSIPAFLSLQTFVFPPPHHTRKVLTYSSPGEIVNSVSSSSSTKLTKLLGVPAMQLNY